MIFFLNSGFFNFLIISFLPPWETQSERSIYRTDPVVSYGYISKLISTPSSLATLIISIAFCISGQYFSPTAFKCESSIGTFVSLPIWIVSFILGSNSSDSPLIWLAYKALWLFNIPAKKFISYIVAALACEKTRPVDIPKAPSSRPSESILPIIFISSSVIFLTWSPNIPRLKVSWPTKVPKLRPIFFLFNSEKKLLVLSQFIFIFPISTHFLIDSIDPSLNIGARDVPQFPPIIVVTPSKTLLSSLGIVKMVQKLSEWSRISINPGQTTFPSASTTSLASTFPIFSKTVIFPFSIPISTAELFDPVPSITIPFFINTSSID